MSSEGDASASSEAPRRFPWRRFARWLLLGCSIGWGASAYTLHRYGLRGYPDEGQWDAIVVLGCRVFPDGQPSRALAARVGAAVELYHQGRAERVVLTGGVGEAGIAEAEVAATLAESLGVPRDDLILEARSTSTEQNARFAAQMFEGRRILIVTDAYHVFRSELVFERYFDEVHGVGTINPRWWPRVKGAFREVAAVAGYGLMRRL